MPNENNETPGQSGSSDPPKEPGFITQDQLNAALSPLTQAFQTMQTSLEAIAAARRDDPSTQNRPTPINLPTDTEILEEIQSGGLSKLKQIITSAVDQIRDKELRPFQQQGMQLLATQAEQLARMSGSMPYYDRFKKQIDDIVKQLPLDQRTNAQNYKIIHDSIVGQNLAALLKEQEENTIRQLREKDPTSLPGNTGGRQSASGETKADGVPTFEDHFGKDALKALQMTRNHNTPDEFARKMGYKDWPDYWTKAIKEGTPA